MNYQELNNGSLQLEIQKQDAEIRLRSLTVKRWLRTNEVALYLGTTVPSVKKMVLRGKLRPHKFAGRLYFERKTLDGLIENSGL